MVSFYLYGRYPRDVSFFKRSILQTDEEASAGRKVIVRPVYAPALPSHFIRHNVAAINSYREDDELLTARRSVIQTSAPYRDTSSTPPNVAALNSGDELLDRSFVSDYIRPFPPQIHFVGPNVALLNAGDEVLQSRRYISDYIRPYPPQLHRFIHEVPPADDIEPMPEQVILVPKPKPVVAVSFNLNGPPPAAASIDELMASRRYISDAYPKYFRDFTIYSHQVPPPNEPDELAGGRRFISNYIRPFPSQTHSFTHQMPPADQAVVENNELFNSRKCLADHAKPYPKQFTWFSHQVPPADATESLAGQCILVPARAQTVSVSFVRSAPNIFTPPATEADELLAARRSISRAQYAYGQNTNWRNAGVLPSGDLLMGMQCIWIDIASGRSNVQWMQRQQMPVTRVPIPIFMSTIGDGGGW